MEYQFALIERQEIAEGTMQFTFKISDGEYHFRAGQHTDYTLVDPPYSDDEGNTRTFSFVNAPNGSTIQIATRMRNTAFKNSLKEIPLGTEVKVKEPMGRFTLHKDATKPAVFLIGGIGITPVMSILREWQKDGEKRDLFLFYANKSQPSAAFYEELDSLARANPNFHFIPTFTDELPANWQGETGRVNDIMIKKFLNNVKDAIFYASGPAAMVGAMVKLAEDLGASEEHIKTEDFAGY